MAKPQQKPGIPGRKPQRPGQKPVRSGPRQPVADGGGNSPRFLHEATVTALNEFGDGVVQLRERTIKVARSLPGDRIRISVPDNGKRFVYGDLVKMLKPSGSRVDPACPAFLAGCGGCQWLALDYAEQLQWKTRIVGELFRQRCPIGVKAKDTIGMERPEAYRNKLSLRNHGGRLVFMQDFADQALAPEQCRVETPAIQAAWTWLRGLTVPEVVLQVHLRSVDRPVAGGENGRSGTVGAHLFVRRFTAAVEAFARQLLEKGDVAGVGATCHEEYRLLGGVECLEQLSGGLRYRIPHDGFFQTNHIQAERLLGLALDSLAPRPDEAVLDLYCGSGYFSLPLARRSRTVLGIEANAASVRRAGENAILNDVGNVRFQSADVAEALRALEPGGWPALLLDPPRSGCGEAVMAEILRLRPQRLVYVSCSPESLVQDLKPLVKGGYRVVSVQPVDMFPHSFHVETVVSLDRGTMRHAR